MATQVPGLRWAWQFPEYKVNLPRPLAGHVATCGLRNWTAWDAFDAPLIQSGCFLLAPLPANVRSSVPAVCAWREPNCAPPARDRPASHRLAPSGASAAISPVPMTRRPAIPSCGADGHVSWTSNSAPRSQRLVGNWKSQTTLTDQVWCADITYISMRRGFFTWSWS